MHEHELHVDSTVRIVGDSQLEGVEARDLRVRLDVVAGRVAVVGRGQSERGAGTRRLRQEALDRVLWERGRVVVEILDGHRHLDDLEVLAWLHGDVQRDVTRLLTRTQLVSVNGHRRLQQPALLTDTEVLTVDGRLSEKRKAQLLENFGSVHRVQSSVNCDIS